MHKNTIVLNKKLLFHTKFSSFLLILLFFTACSTSKKAGNNKSSQVNKIISTARSFTGTPYKWGGTTRAGMDCSGLLVISFRAGGIELPRTSAAQSKYGRNISIHELQPGDLVFFTAGKYKNKITHVGMVTEAEDKQNVKFIHASSSLGVVENNLFSNYYRKIFAKAIRPF